MQKTKIWMIDFQTWEATSTTICSYMWVLKLQAWRRKLGNKRDLNQSIRETNIYLEEFTRSLPVSDQLIGDLIIKEDRWGYHHMVNVLWIDKSEKGKASRSAKPIIWFYQSCKKSNPKSSPIMSAKKTTKE